MERNPSLLRDIGKRLLEERTRLGKTQKEMAEILGVTPQWYGKVERGSSGPSLGMLNMLDSKCDVDVSFIITGRKSPQTNLDKIIENYPEDVRFHFETILRAAQALYSKTETATDK